jgi:SAM-dependent methyltransferase
MMPGTDRTMLNHAAWRTFDYRPVVAEILPVVLPDFLVPGQRVLEIGCGSGAASIFLARQGLHVTGLDINSGAVQAARDAAERARVADRAEFHAADFLAEPVTGRFDAVVLVRVLTCLPDPAAWKAMVDKVRGSIAQGGLLYIYDFALTPEVYGERYARGHRDGLGSGNFAVPGPDGNTLFVAHHHSEEEIGNISSGYRAIYFNRRAGSSMNGNRCQVFEVLARKECR